jgi:acyl-CoA thioesterase YciA
MADIGVLWFNPVNCSPRREIKMTTPQIPTVNTINRGLPAGKMPELRMMPAPSDANVYGDVFGGWIMAQVDIAGSLPATRRANGRVATIAVNSFVFKNPVFVGDLLSFYADIVKVGNTSITVQVEVYAERNRLQADTVKVTEATLTYVATDSDRKPRKVPPIETLINRKPSPRLPHGRHRRQFLATASRLGALAALPAPARASAQKPQRLSIQLGVASGSPLPDAVVIWTRILHDPLNAAATPPIAFSVRWEMAEDEQFRRIVARHSRRAARPGAQRPCRRHRPAAGPLVLVPLHAGRRRQPIGRTRTARRQRHAAAAQAGRGLLPALGIRQLCRPSPHRPLRPIWWPSWAITSTSGAHTSCSIPRPPTDF